MLDIYEISQRLILHEGLRLQPYRCIKGRLTIGVGRNLDSNPLSSEEKSVLGDWKHGITTQEAMYLLRNDILKINTLLKKHIKFFSKLDDERQYALIDMAFNMGIGGLLQFKKMLKAIEQKKFNQAADECLNSQYAKITKKRAIRIAEVIRNGTFKI